jgi:radical SAM protein with 4Fe4S-binding SPASM domain
MTKTYVRTFIAKMIDAWGYFSKLDGRKLLNMAKVLASFYRARWDKKGKIWGYPVSLSFEPTTACNLKCPHCPSGLRAFSRPTGKAKSSLFEQILEEVGNTLTYLTFYFQGEPYLHQDFLKWVKMARQKNIYTATSTNGHYFSPQVAEQTVLSGLDRVIVSIDGAEQESYEKYRIGGNLEKVKQGLRHLKEAKLRHKSRTPFVMLQFIVFKHNQNEVAAIKKMGADLGVDEVVIKTAQIYDYENATDFIPDKQDWARYKRDIDGKFKFKNKLFDHCWRMWHSCVLTFDGRVVPCCFDKDAHYTLGKVGEVSFKSIWQSVDYQAFRKQLFTARKEIDMCTNCSEGTKVWI